MAVLTIPRRISLGDSSHGPHRRDGTTSTIRQFSIINHEAADEKEDATNDNQERLLKEKTTKKHEQAKAS